MADKRNRAVKLPDRTGTGKRYAVLLPELEAQLQTLYRRLRKLLSEQGFSPTIKYRVKKFDNYFHKMTRLSQAEPDRSPLVYDLLGLRVISPFLEDLTAIEQLITANFKVVELERKGERHSFREFGYDSVHLLIQLDDGDSKRLPRTGAFCEIQLRTILQDAWAEVEHELVYKSDLAFPNDSIKRKLASLNASLGLSDLIFQEIRDYQKELRERGLKRRQSVEELLSATGRIEIEQRPQGVALAEEQDAGDAELGEVPQGLEKLMFRALQEHSNKNFPTAIKIYGKVLHMKLSHQLRSLVYNHRGMALFALAEYQRAIEDFSKALDYNENNCRAWCNRGLVYRVQGKYDQSLADYGRAVDLSATTLDGFWGRAQTCFEMKLFSRALSDCRVVLGLQADFRPALELQKAIHREVF
ncbi:MAG TPA: tetratricopeptide repeat protein [Malonomonas sp.]